MKFSVFSNTVSGPSFACLDSYPVDDTASPASGTIRTENVPLYNSQKYGEFNLRDCVDFRPRRDDEATTMSNIELPVPNTNWSADYSYYLPRVTGTASFNCPLH